MKKKRIIAILLIACLVAFGDIVFMCLDNDSGTLNTAERHADKEVASGTDTAVTEDGYSSDPYERAEQIKADNPEAESEGYIVTLSEDAGDDVVQAVENAAADGTGITKLEYTDRTYRCDSLEEFKALADPECVEAAEPDFLMHICEEVTASGTAPNDVYYGSQYNITNLKVPAVWDAGLEGQDTDLNNDADNNKNYKDDIIVAVIDSGLYVQHDDIDRSRVVGGASFVSNTSETSDENGHGTMVSGIIAAKKNNGAGIAGLLQEVKIMPIKVFDSSGSAYTSTITEAVNYAVNQKKAGTNIAVINMSLGGSAPSTSLKQACESAMGAGIIVVCAAGNDYDSVGHEANYPAQYAMGVGSLNKNQSVSAFSQRINSAEGEGYEKKVWVTAPGEDIYGPSYTGSNQYRIGSGTSFACPEVAALAAICKSIDNNMTQTRFMELLKSTAVPAGQSGKQDEAYGWGKVDFSRTVTELLKNASGPSELTVTVKNKAGSEISGAAVTVKEKDSGNTVTPGADGKWTLQKRKRYTINASAGDDYDPSASEVVPVLDSTAITITLDGTRNYSVSLDVKDINGDPLTLPEGDSVSVGPAAGSGTYTPDDNGKYSLRVGWYKFKLKSDTYYIDGDNVFSVDDMNGGISNGSMTVEVRLRKDAVNLVWNDHSGTTKDKSASLVQIINSSSDRYYNISDGTDSVQIYGITVYDLFDELMKMDENIVSVTIEGKRLKSYTPDPPVENDETGKAADDADAPAAVPETPEKAEISKESGDTAAAEGEAETAASGTADAVTAEAAAADTAAADVNAAESVTEDKAAVPAAESKDDNAAPAVENKAPEDIAGGEQKNDADADSEKKDDPEVTAAASYELEDASVTLTGSDIQKAYIALLIDPSGHDDILDAYNSMRLVINGRDRNDWLYAPSTITITTKAYMSKTTISGLTAASYNGGAITPKPVVKYKSEELKEGRDYTVSYSNNVNAGTATVTVTGKGGFTGVKTATFRINPRKITPAVSLSGTSFTYTAGAIRPGVTVKDGSRVLANGRDYSVSYSNNVNVGTGYVTVTLKGNYQGSRKVAFRITTRNITPAVSVNGSSFTFTGGAICPGVTVRDGGRTLAYNRDYTVSYSNNVNVGTGYVTVNLKGNYRGSRTASFYISPRWTTPGIALSATDFTWNNQVQAPGVAGVYDGGTAIPPWMYSVSYAAGSEVGTYYVTVSLGGNYAGSNTVIYTIGPKGTKCTRATRQKKAVTVRWSRQSGRLMKKKRITGYQVQASPDPNFGYDVRTVTVKGYSKTSRKVSGLSPKTRYYVRVRTYMNYNGGTYYSYWSNVKSAVTR